MKIVGLISEAQVPVHTVLYMVCTFCTLYRYQRSTPHKKDNAVKQVNSVLCCAVQSSGHLFSSILKPPTFLGANDIQQVVCRGPTAQPGRKSDRLAGRRDMRLGLLCLLMVMQTPRCVSTSPGMSRAGTAPIPTSLHVTPTPHH